MVVAVVAIALAVIVAVVAFGGDDAPAPVATDEALAAIEALEALVADERAEADADERTLGVDLDPCPLGELDEVFAFAPEGLATPTGEGTRTAAITSTGDEDEPTSFQCFLDLDDESGGIGGTLVGRASDGSHRAYLRRTLSFADVDFGEERKHRGGEIVTYCVESETSDSGSFSFCAADWVTEEVQFGVYLSVDQDDLPLVGDLLEASLDHLAEQLLDNAGDVGIVAP